MNKASLYVDILMPRVWYRTEEGWEDSLCASIPRFFWALKKTKSPTPRDVMTFKIAVGVGAPIA